MIQYNYVTKTKHKQKHKKTKSTNQNKYHTVGTFLKSNSKIIDTETKLIPLIHTYTCIHIWQKLPIPSEMMRLVNYEIELALIFVLYNADTFTNTG